VIHLLPFATLAILRQQIIYTPHSARDNSGKCALTGISLLARTAHGLKQWCRDTALGSVEYDCGTTDAFAHQAKGSFMKHSVSLFSVIVLCSLVCSCTNPAHDGSAAAAISKHGSAALRAHHVAVTHDIPYGDATEQMLDLYIQGNWTGEPNFFERSTDPRSTLLFIHGGGWVVRDRSPEPWVLPFAEQGWHVVSMTYRLGPGTAPAAVDDAMCALDWVVRNADQYGFDLEKIVVAGVSAGGHLSLTTGILGSRPAHDCYPGNGFRVQSVINWFGITDIAAVSSFLDANPPSFGNYAHAWVGDESRLADISAAYSPIHLVDAGSPPVLTIHGTDDVIVPYDQAVLLDEKLQELGIRNRLLSLENGTHAGFTDTQFLEAFEAMLTFVEAK